MAWLGGNYIPRAMFQLETAARGFYRLTGLSNMNEFARLRHPALPQRRHEVGSMWCKYMWIAGVDYLLLRQASAQPQRHNHYRICIAANEFAGNRCKSILFVPRPTNRQSSPLIDCNCVGVCVCVCLAAILLCCPNLLCNLLTHRTEGEEGGGGQVPQAFVTAI